MPFVGRTLQEVAEYRPRNSRRAAEECSRAGARDRALAIDDGCRSSEASAISARTASRQSTAATQNSARKRGYVEAIHLGCGVTAVVAVIASAPGYTNARNLPLRIERHRGAAV